MTSCYEFFGFSVISSQPIPGLTPLASNRSDIYVELGGRPSDTEVDRARERLLFASSMTSEFGEPALRLFGIPSQQVYHLIYQDGVEFWLDPPHGRIWSVWPGHLTLDHVAPYLLGPVLGLLLRFRGIVCLHASAVVIQGRAVLFTGDAGAGKSTTAAAMSERGHALLADDIVAILERDGKFLATPAYPYISLWPQATEMICGPGAKLPRLTPDIEKQRFSPLRFQDSPVPLGSIFVFGERSGGENAPRVETLARREQIMALVANSYATVALPDASRAEEFEVFGRVTGAVLIRRLIAHSDSSLLNRLCECVEEQCGPSQAIAFAARLS